MGVGRRAGSARGGLIRSASGPLGVAAVVWLIAETMRLSVSAAQSADVGLTRLRLHTVVEFVGTAGGRATLLSLLAAVLAGAIAVFRPGRAGRIAVTGAVAVGLSARAVSGHVGASAIGAVAIVVHILAAALWCGVLSAITVTVDHRAQWARILPRFSQLALGCAVTLLVAGTAGALVTVPGPAQLLTTGYGRVLLAKVVVAAGLVALGWLNRTRWLPAARAHRISAERAVGYARRELVVMVIALTLAAALSLAG